MFQSLRAATVLCALLTSTEFSIAGVVINGQSTNLRDKKILDITMLADGSRLRTNVKGEDTDVSLIFQLLDGDDYKMFVLDNTKNEYRIIDRKTMEELSVQVGGAMAKMQEQMKKMTPEQRAMMEKMMGKMAGMRGETATPVEIKFNKIGSGNVNGRACTKYEGTLNDQKMSELCAAPAESLNITPTDFAVVEKMTAVFEDMAKSLGQLPFLRAGGMKFFEKQIDGIPIEHVQFDGGQPVSRFEFKDSSRRDFSDSDFSVGNAKQMDLIPPARSR